MDDFENELRRVVGRREPPDDFSARVLERLPERRVQSFWRGSLTFNLARVALCCLLVLFAANAWQRHQLRASRGLEAKRQLFLALRIASAQIHDTQSRVAKVESQ